ncbi:hypothetical protein [Streptomyces sp. SID13726]|uniref:hypothetical protein n=1 Tax=Streptomyces sp. SID13726 TaxID=2706058 RepID=UPI001EF37339
MAVARLDLTATAVRARLALTGVGLAVLGYGGSWPAPHLVPGALAKLSAGGRGESGPAASAWCSDTWGYPDAGTPAGASCSPHPTARPPSPPSPTPAWRSQSWRPASPPSTPPPASTASPAPSSPSAPCP